MLIMIIYSDWLKKWDFYNKLVLFFNLSKVSNFKVIILTFIIK